jgi:UDP-N-acetylmuramoyl-L-alanyl-D-glutamate--2,6-diaminopimelate ligase
MQLGVSLEAACKALETAKGVKCRVEVVPTDGDYTILIDYAHTPDALDNVLDSMRHVTEGRLVALFGCGGDRDRTKRPVMGRIAQENADLVIVTSDNPRTEDPMDIIQDILKGMYEEMGNLEVIPDRVKAIEWAIENHRDGDVIILAGKGHEDYQIIGTEKFHMDEREIVAEILNRRRERK